MAVDNKTITDTNKRYVSPKGTLEPYAYLNKPDYGRDHFANERGKYKAAITMDLSDPKVQELCAFLTEVYDKTYEVYLQDNRENPPKVVKGKKILEPYQGDLPFIENDDGTVTFKFDAWAAYTDSKTNEIKPISLSYADARGKPIKQKELPNIFGGSTLRASFKILPYGWSNVAGASIKLQLQGVMLIDVVESSGGTDEFSEFAEEDGYEADGSLKADPSDRKGSKDDAPWNQDDDQDLGTNSGNGDF